MSKTREFKKASKKLLESTVLSDISRNTALDLMLKKAQQNKQSEVHESGIKDIVLKHNYELPLLKDMPVIDLEKMNKNSLIRKGGYENVNNN